MKYANNSSGRPPLLASITTEKVLWEGRCKFSSLLAHRIAKDIFFMIAFAALAFFGRRFGLANVPFIPESARQVLRVAVVVIAIAPLLHLFFVIIYAKASWHGTYYILTPNEAIVQSRGLIRTEVKTIYYREVARVFYKRDILDYIFGTGRIRFVYDGWMSGMNPNHTQQHRATRAAALNELRYIAKSQKIFAILQKAVARSKGITQSGKEKT